jgi:hypothetical protein
MSVEMHQESEDEEDHKQDECLLFCGKRGVHDRGPQFLI